MLRLDGAYGEGGGALIRTALQMSALTLRPVSISQVRANTPFPGLDPEDLTLARALAQSTHAELVEAEVGSEQFAFIPTRRPAGLQGKVPIVRHGLGRGPNALVIANALIPVAARSGVYSSFSVEGETYGPNVLTYDAFAESTTSVYRKMGIYLEPTLKESGFGRESRGVVNIDVEPSFINGLQWEDRGSLQSLSARFIVSNLSMSIAQRGIGHLKRLAQNANLPIECEAVEVPGITQGAFCTIWARYERAAGSGSASGARGLRAEHVAQQAFDQLFNWMRSPSTIDSNLADQILLPLAISEEPSCFTVGKLTERFMTQVWVIKQFLPIHLTVKGTVGSAGTVTIQRR
jgi:RNA 3'-phosphate cyclase